MHVQVHVLEEMNLKSGVDTKVKRVILHEFMLISLELFLSNKIINFSLSVAFVSFFSYLKRFCNDYNCECKI